jgi:hypothetical protein
MRQYKGTIVKCAAMTPEQAEALKVHLDEIAKILYAEAESSEPEALNSLEGSVFWAEVPLPPESAVAAVLSAHERECLL